MSEEKGKKGKGKGKENGKGKRRKDSEEAEKEEPPSIFAGKAYEDSVKELVASTDARILDFNERQVVLLDALEAKGKAKEALSTLSQSLKGRKREEIKNWRAYIHTILRKIDPEAYKDFKATKENEKAKSVPVSLSKSLPADPPHKFCVEASEFKPGQAAHGAQADAGLDKHKFSKEATEFKPGQKKHPIAVETADGEKNGQQKAKEGKGSGGKVDLDEKEPVFKPGEPAKGKKQAESEPGFLECCFRRMDD